MTQDEVTDSADGTGLMRPSRVYVTFEGKRYEGPFSYDLASDVSDQAATAQVLDRHKNVVTLLSASHTSGFAASVAVRGNAEALVRELNDTYATLVAESGSRADGRALDGEAIAVGSSSIESWLGAKGAALLERLAWLGGLAMLVVLLLVTYQSVTAPLNAAARAQLEQETEYVTNLLSLELVRTKQLPVKLADSRWSPALEGVRVSLVPLGAGAVRLVVQEAAEDGAGCWRTMTAKGTVGPIACGRPPDVAIPYQRRGR